MDRIEEMLNQYCLEHYKELQDIEDWELVSVERNGCFEVDCYGYDKKLFTVVITMGELLSWIWFHTMKNKM